MKGLSKVAHVHAAFDVCGVTDATVTCIDKTTSKPKVVKLPEPITKIAHDSASYCGLTASKTIVCWPLYEREKRPPEVLPGIADVIAFDGDITGMCAATASNEVVCWGGMDHVPADRPKRIQL